MKWRLWGNVALVILLFSLAGCGPGEGTVSGRVLYNNKPLPGGFLTFRPSDPRANSVTVDLPEDGTYKVVLPAGEVQICVDNRELEPLPAMTAIPANLPPDARKAIAASKAEKGGGEGGGRKASPRYVKFPEKYFNVESSGLRFKVERGPQTKDIELTP